MNELKDLYISTIAPKLMKELHLKNVHQVPKLVKINVNVGIGTYLKGSSDYEAVINNIASITGQKPLLKRASKSVSNFKLREGQPNGVTVTLRGEMMYDFMYKLINVVLPRVRDFRGLSDKSFDGHGNYSLGISDHTIFPEIQIDDIVRTHGVQITIVTSTSSNDEARLLMKEMNFPFKKPKKAKKTKETN